MSRTGSMTTAMPRSGSATRKLALPSSGPRIVSPVHTPQLPQGDRRRRQEHPYGDERHHHSAPIEEDLRRRAFSCRHAEIDEQVAQPVREMEKRERDEDCLLYTSPS